MGYEQYACIDYSWSYIGVYARSEYMPNFSPALKSSKAEIRKKEEIKNYKELLSRTNLDALSVYASYKTFIKTTAIFNISESELKANTPEWIIAKYELLENV